MVGRDGGGEGKGMDEKGEVGEERVFLHNTCIYTKHSMLTFMLGSI